MYVMTYHGVDIEYNEVMGLYIFGEVSQVKTLKEMYDYIDNHGLRKF